MQLSGRDYASRYRAFRDFFPHAFNERAIARPARVHLRHATVLNVAVIARGSSGPLTIASHKKGKEKKETLPFNVPRDGQQSSREECRLGSIYGGMQTSHD